MTIAKRRSAVLRADVVEDKRELLHRRNDDLLAIGDEAPQVAGMLGVATVAPTCANCLIVSRICLSRMRRSVTTITESKTWPPSKPASRTSWCASQAMEFDLPDPAECWMSTPPPCPFILHRRAACARRRADGSAETIGRASPCRSSGPALDDLGVVLDNVGEAKRREHVLPQIIRLQANRIGRIAGAVVPAFVEGQKPGRLCL